MLLIVLSCLILTSQGFCQEKAKETRTSSDELAALKGTWERVESAQGKRYVALTLEFASDAAFPGFIGSFAIDYVFEKDGDEGPGVATVYFNLEEKNKKWVIVPPMGGKPISYKLDGDKLTVERAYQPPFGRRKVDMSGVWQRAKHKDGKK
jgi:hypothetical protein